MIDSTTVKTLFDYADGVLYWRVNRKSNKVAGKAAGSVNSEGYCKIKIFRKIYSAHRLIWLWHEKELPAGYELDHINGNPADNRIENLRLSTHAENTQNAAKRRDNTSGYKNISFVKSTKKWRVMMNANKQIAFIGYFDSLIAAREAAKNARKTLHASFAREC